MGAYLMSRTFPYSIIAMSDMPIITKDMYTGPFAWPEYDYIVFPAGIVLEDSHDASASGGRVHVSYGHQDCSAFLLTLNVSLLISNLVKL